MESPRVEPDKALISPLPTLNPTTNTWGHTITNCALYIPRKIYFILCVIFVFSIRVLGGFNESKEKDSKSLPLASRNVSLLSESSSGDLPPNNPPKEEPKTPKASYNEEDTKVSDEGTPKKKLEIEIEGELARLSKAISVLPNNEVDDDEPLPLSNSYILPDQDKTQTPPTPKAKLDPLTQNPLVKSKSDRSLFSRILGR